MSSVWDLFSLKGRVAIVTGGAGRLGSQMCDALAEAGAHLVVASRDGDKCRRKADALSASHAEAIGLSLDHTDRASADAMVAAVMEKYGRIDVLVNNAYTGAAQRFEEMTAGEFEAALRGGITGTFVCSQAAATIMKQQQSGVIVNLGSIYGLVSPDQRIYGKSGLNSPCNYAPAKAGIIQFTRYLATYLAPHGIRVNCLTPGGFYDAGFQSRPEYDEVFVKNYSYKTPLGRMGNPTDLKGAIVYLASDASAYVTSHNLVVDGGWTAW
ncbi:MAG: SDR family oxidoreductase [Acidobacteria bacterium]|nr:SDR family oxidoreductase [Acidobacteriota bacterium]